MARLWVVGQVGDIPVGARRIVQIEGREIGIFNVAGNYYALPSYCIHQGGPLCNGIISGTVAANAATGWELQWVLDGEIVSCPWHGLEFNITTGQCLALPRRRLRTYPVIIEDEQIKVAI